MIKFFRENLFIINTGSRMADRVTEGHGVFQHIAVAILNGSRSIFSKVIGLIISKPGIL
jgi:hypothetical protein